MAEGMMTMVEDGMIKAAQDITSVEEVLRVARLEDLSKSSGFAGYLQRAHITMTVSELLGSLVKWLLLLIFFIASVEILGLTIVSNVLQQLLAILFELFQNHSLILNRISIFLI